MKENYISVGNVNVKDQGLDKALRLYPNPTSGLVNVTWNGDMTGELTLSVFNILGKELSETKMQARSTTVDLGNQPDGLYILKVQAGEKIITKKLALFR